MRAIFTLVVLALATVVASAEEIRTTYLFVQPASLPAPHVLEYQLQPTVTEQTPGDALSDYYFADQNYAGAVQQQTNQDAETRLTELTKDGLTSAADADEAAELLKPFEHILRRYAEATKREQCDWNLHIREKGIMAMFPAFGRYRNASRLLLARAEVAAYRHQNTEAIDDLKTINAMADHISQADTLVTSLVATAMVHESLKGVEQMIQQPGSPNLYWALTTLPTPRIDYRSAMRNEFGLFYFTFPELIGAERGTLTDEQWEQLWPKLIERYRQFKTVMYGSGDGTSPPPVDEKAAQAALDKQIESAYPQAQKVLIEQVHLPTERVAKMSRQAVVIRASFEQDQILRQQSIRCFALPYWQARPLADQVEAQIKQWHSSDQMLLPFAEQLPSLYRARFIQARLDRQIAMLRIIEAIRLYAVDHAEVPAKLDDLTLPISPDPVTGQPFEYVPTDDRLSFSLTGKADKAHSEDGLRYVVTLKTK